MKNNKLLASIFLIVFIDLLGFSFILPLLPYYAKTFQASDLQIGLLVAAYAAAQLVGAPLLGRLSDRYGRRPMLMVSIFGTVLSFILLAFSRSLWMLYVSRILDGLTAGNISIAQAYISDVTDASNRSRGLGLVGAAFGLGFIIGPAAGGALSQFGFAVPAFTAAGLAAFNFLMVTFWLPESLSKERRDEIARSGRSAISLKDMFSALRRPTVGPLLHSRFFFGLAFSIFQTIFSLYALERFNLNSTQTGYILAYVGVLSVITQGFLIGRLTVRFAETRLILISTITMAVSLLVWALAPNIPVLLIILIPMAFSGGVLNTVINSALSKSVQPVEIGGILGISSSLEAFTRVIAPSLGGLILEVVGKNLGTAVGTAAPGLLAALIMAWLVSYTLRHVVNLPLGSGAAPAAPPAVGN